MYLKWPFYDNLLAGRERKNLDETIQLMKERLDLSDEDE